MWVCCPRGRADPCTVCLRTITQQLLSPRFIRIFEKIKTFLLNSTHNVPSLVCIYRSHHVYAFYLTLKASSVHAACFNSAPRCHYVLHSHTQVCELDDRRGSEAPTSQLKPSFYGVAFWRWINSYNQPRNVCGNDPHWHCFIPSHPTPPLKLPHCWVNQSWWMMSGFKVVIGPRGEPLLYGFKGGTLRRQFHLPSGVISNVKCSSGFKEKRLDKN